MLCGLTCTQLSNEDKSRVRALALPESTESFIGDTSFCFRVRLYVLGAVGRHNNQNCCVTQTLLLCFVPRFRDALPLFSASPAGHKLLFGFVFFRRSKSTSSARGYSQVRAASAALMCMGTDLWDGLAGVACSVVATATAKSVYASSGDCGSPVL